MEKLNQNSEIKNIGSFFEIDSEGNIVNPASLEKIQEKWMEPIQKVVEAYKEQFGNKLISVYLRGSVAKGQAIEGVSDLDIMAFIDMESSNLDDLSWSEKMTTEIKQSFPFVDKVEVDPVALDEINKRRDIPIALKTSSVLLYGKDLAADMPKLHPGPETFLHLPHMARILENWIPRIQVAENEIRVKRLCTSVMKRVVRSGGELVMERSQKYTRDLYPCWQVFSDYYPEKKYDMQKALELSINPSGDKEEILKLFQDLANWLKSEYEKNYLKS